MFQSSETAPSFSDLAPAATFQLPLVVEFNVLRASATRLAIAEQQLTYCSNKECCAAINCFNTLSPTAMSCAFCGTTTFLASALQIGQTACYQFEIEPYEDQFYLLILADTSLASCTSGALSSFMDTLSVWLDSLTETRFMVGLITFDSFFTHYGFKQGISRSVQLGIRSCQFTGDKGLLLEAFANVSAFAVKSRRTGCRLGEALAGGLRVLAAKDGGILVAMVGGKPSRILNEEQIARLTTDSSSTFSLFSYGQFKVGCLSQAVKQSNGLACEFKSDFERAYYDVLFYLSNLRASTIYSEVLLSAGHSVRSCCCTGLLNSEDSFTNIVYSSANLNNCAYLEIEGSTAPCLVQTRTTYIDITLKKYFMRFSTARFQLGQQNCTEKYFAFSVREFLQAMGETSLAQLKDRLDQRVKQYEIATGRPGHLALYCCAFYKSILLEPENSQTFLVNLLDPAQLLAFAVPDLYDLNSPLEQEALPAQLRLSREVLSGDMYLMQVGHGFIVYLTNNQAFLRLFGKRTRFSNQLREEDMGFGEAGHRVRSLVRLLRSRRYNWHGELKFEQAGRPSKFQTYLILDKQCRSNYSQYIYSLQH